MVAEIRRISDLSDADCESWAVLADAAISPNPFAEAASVAPAARHFRDAEDVAMLVVRRGSEWLAAAPVRPARSYWRFRGRYVVAWRHPQCFLGSPLVAGPDPAAALAVLLRRGLEPTGSLGLEWIDADGPLAGALDQALDAVAWSYVIDQFERPALDRCAEAPTSKRSRRARARRGLEKRLGALSVHDRSQDPDAYRQFLALEASSWKGRLGSALACDPAQTAFFLETCERFAAAGRLQLLTLGNESRTAAMVCNLIAGDTIFGFKTAFADDLARFSPGVLLHAEQVERFPTSGFARLDTCAEPNNVTMSALYTGRRRLRNIVAVRRSVAGAATAGKWAAALSARRATSSLARARRHPTAGAGAARGA